MASTRERKMAWQTPAQMLQELASQVEAGKFPEHTKAVVLGRDWCAKSQKKLGLSLAQAYEHGCQLGPKFN